MARGRERESHPIEDIRSVAESMCRVFRGRAGGSSRRRKPSGGRVPERQLSLKEDGRGFWVTLELPEVSKKDLHVHVAENSVTIFGHWLKEVKAKERVEHVREMYSRLLHLPAPVRAEKARATFKGRVLKILLPRAKPARAGASK
jgi:HSP20 family protein